MAITLQVVGIFFQADLALHGEQHIIDVLNAASNSASVGKIANVTMFSYETTSPPNQSVVSFSVRYSGPVVGRGVGRTYGAGEYFLAEDLNARPAYNVWQYYVLDAAGKALSRGVKFLDDSQATVPAGGKLIWRLVSILATAHARPAIAEARQLQA